MARLLHKADPLAASLIRGWPLQLVVLEHLLRPPEGTVRPEDPWMQCLASYMVGLHSVIADQIADTPIAAR